MFNFELESGFKDSITTNQITDYKSVMCLVFKTYAFSNNKVLLSYCSQQTKDTL